MIAMIHHGCEVEALPEHDSKNHQWIVHLKIKKNERGIVVSEDFRLTETYLTEKEAINRCWDYGKKIINGEMKGFPKGNS
ncbi:MAG: hypothetical protein HY895_08330 [Deltaproteobacteria bacterium]|nr:hypothetical protein [Deltaproteobacteria bacterium]